MKYLSYLIAVLNLSDGRRYTVSAFRGTTAVLDVLRGSYMLDAEGTLRYRRADGTEHVKYYRASENYVEIVAHPTQISTKIIFM